MARRKQEVALQSELETQEDWEDALSKEGLLVVDVYQEWCGPCAAMLSNFRRIKNELGDDLLKFAVAKADTIDSLESYRGKCEPFFLIYGSGSLVAYVAGARAPVLSKCIPEQLAIEHKVLAGDSERKVIRDPMFEEVPEKAQVDEDENEKEEIEVETEITVCLIKPDAVEAGKVEEIMEQLEAHGMEVLKQEVRQLTEEEARSFYAAHEEEDYFEDLVKFMCSGPSHVLVLSETSGQDTISKFRDLIGPKKVEEAKEQAPESLRALYGTSSMTNALHGSDDKDHAMKELAFFFPDYAIPTHKVKQKKHKIQRTLALIRPDALREHKDEILAKIKESGFQIAFQKEVQLTKEQAEEFYSEHRGEEYFEELTERMSSGPLLALALARQDAVQGWREMLGPKEVPKAKEEAPHSLRAQYSVDESINAMHGSETPDVAEQELKYFFPMQQTVAVVKPDAYQTKDEIIKRIHEAGFRIAARKETEVTKDIAEQMYESIKGEEYFDQLTDHMSSGQTLFMVLSREDAVEGWRSLIGPTDPNVAKEQAPHSIRAELGVAVAQNAVHGSSDPEHAKKEMELIFGDMEFNEDGTVKGAEPDLDAAVVERADSGEQDEPAPAAEAEAQEGEPQTEGDSEEPAQEGQVSEEAGEGEAEQTPAEETTAEGEEAPAAAAEETEAPATEGTEAPAEGGDTEAAATEAPAESGEAPAEGAEESTDAPAETEAAPVESTEAAADAPAESTETPAETTEQAGESTEAPADEPAPVDAGDATTEAAEAPADTTEAAAENVEAPTETAEASEPPAETSEPPAETSEPPAESSEPPAEGEVKPPEETAG